MIKLNFKRLRRPALYFAFGLNLLTFSATAMDDEGGSGIGKLKSTAWSLRVRSADGDHLCSIREGTTLTPVGRHEDSDRIEVATDNPKCKKGFVDIRYVRPVEQDKNVIVDEAGLSLRKEPTVSDDTFLCSLPKNTPLSIVDTKQHSEETSWIKVQIPQDKVPKYCPNEGWVSSSYVRSSTDFSALPVTGKEDKSDTEAKNCPKCEVEKKDPELAGSKIWAAAQRASGLNPFLEALKKLAKTKKCSGTDYKCNRGLIQMPLVGANAGFCGTHHYYPDRPYGIDAYTNPLTACALTALAQEWKKNYCKNRSGCTLQWGDISHRTKVRFPPHVTHTDGTCVDIRPMRSGGFSDSGITYGSRGYDRAKTNQFIKLAKSMGASLVIYNDPKISARRAGGHNNHIHLCFNNNPSSRKTCNNLKVDPETCPELQ